MKTRMATIAAAALIAVMLAGCGHRPSEAACKNAMKAQLAYGFANPGGPPASKPKDCQGLDDKTLERLATEILTGQ